MGQSKFAVLALTVCGLVVGCSSTSTNTVSRECADGEIQLCQHTSGCAARKVCDGELFGPCECADGTGGTGASASGGSGGSGASSGAAGDAGAAGSGGTSGGAAGSGGSAGSGGAAGGTAGSGPCGGTQKLCGVDCVDLDLPDKGCAATTCDPCDGVQNGSAVCNAGLCDLNCDVGLALCDVDCVDLTNDPMNCGTCRHSCAAGQCINGKCQPFTVATPTEPLGIVADATHAYWVDSAGGNISRAPFGVGAQSEEVVGGLSNPWDLVLIGTEIYFIEKDSANGRVAHVPKAGGSVVNVATGLNLPSVIAGDAQGLYWGLEGGNTINDSNAKSRAAANPQGIAVDGDSVYYSAFSAGDVVRVPRDLDDTNSFTVASTQTSPTSIALSSTNIYWVQRSAGGGVYVAGKSGTAATLFEQADTPYDVALDSTYVYWVARGAGGTVQRRAIAGGAVETLATAQGAVHSLVVTPTLIYWTVQAPGGGPPGAVRAVVK